MPFPPLTFGATADPITSPTAQQLADLLTCGALDLGLLNGILKAIADRVDEIDAADNAIVSAVYNSATNVLTFTMADGPAVNIDMAGLLSDAVATGIITGSSYNPATNILTLTTANGDTIPIDMTAVITDAVGTSLTPQYAVIAWSPPSPATAVPTGWALCDGSNGTPDLRDRFIVGAGGSHAIGDTGGAASHDHGGVTGEHVIDLDEIPPHFHYVASPATALTTLTAAPEGSIAWSNGNSPGEEEYELRTTGNQDASIGRTSMAGGELGALTGHNHTISVNSNLPPYRALYFIMKL